MITKIPTHQDFAHAVALLEVLTLDTVVTRLDEGVEANSKHPGDLHIYSSFVIPDAGPPCNVVTKYLKPAIRKMAACLSGIPTIAVLALTGVPEGLVMGCYNFPDSVLPLRFITHYDMLNEGYRVSIELYCRQINSDILIYFLRKKGTNQYYQRRGGRKHHCGDKRGTCAPKWGLMTTAACWTSPNGPRPVKGSDGEIVSFPLTIEKELTL